MKWNKNKIWIKRGQVAYTLFLNLKYSRDNSCYLSSYFSIHDMYSSLKGNECRNFCLKVPKDDGKQIYLWQVQALHCDKKELISSTFVFRHTGIQYASVRVPIISCFHGYKTCFQNFKFSGVGKSFAFLFQDGIGC